MTTRLAADISSTGNAASLLDRFHVGALRLGIWAIPGILVIDTIAKALGGDPSIPAWYVYVPLFLVAVYQRRQARPNATWLLGTASTVVGVLFIVENEIDRDLGAPDSATTLVVMVSLGIVMSATSRTRNPAGLGVQGLAVAGVAVLSGRYDATGPDRIVVRTAAALSVYLLASWILHHLRRDLDIAVETNRANAVQTGALARLSTELLADGEEQLERGVRALAESLALERLRLVRDGRTVFDIGAAHGQPNSHTIRTRSELGGRLDVWGEDAIDTDTLFTAAGMIESFWEREASRRSLESSLSSNQALIAAVSHELRTPLTGIVGFAEVVLAEGGVPDHLTDYINVIHEEGREMSEIIEDLLASAQADTGTLAVGSEWVDLRAQVDAVLSHGRVQQLGSEKEISVTGQSIDAWADPLRCRQVLRNLVTNALRYGGDEIRVQLELVKGRPRVSVADNGAPLASHTIEQLFEPFFRAQDSGQSGSVGLGLSVSRSLARAMGGDVTARHDGGWNIFTLDLPPAPNTTG